MDAGSVDRALPSGASFLDGGLVPPAGEKPVQRGHDVLAGGQQAGDDVRVGHHRRIDDALGLEGDE